MAIPLTYNMRSLRVRWASTVVAVLGITGTVGVFVAMLALAKGFRATLVSSGSPQNAIIRRAGSTSEMESAVTTDQVHVIEDMPGVARKGSEPLVSPETVVVAAFPLKATGTDAYVQVRGVSPRVLEVRPQVKIVAGRFFRPGLDELVVGRNVNRTYSGFDLGSTVKFGGGTWTVVGVFDAGGSAFDSELWADAQVVKQVYKRPLDVYQSVTARLTSADAYPAFKDAITSDPRVTLQVDRETYHSEKQSRAFSRPLSFLGFLVGGVMRLCAIIAALNTMYSAVAERAREIATMRAVGFGTGSVVASFTFEALCIAFIGGLLGCIAVLPINGLTTGAMNWQTFSHLAFAFRVTPALLIGGLMFALAMGVAGGVPPAIRAARARIALALREL